MDHYSQHTRRRLSYWVDPHWPAEQRARVIQAAVRHVWTMGQGDGHGLSADDRTDLRAWTGDDSAAVRHIAVSTLCHTGPVTWEDLTHWMLDPAADVRHAVLGPLTRSWTPVRRLCTTDPHRCAELLAAVALRYHDAEVGCVLRQLAGDDAWLEVVWQTAEALLDHNIPALTSMLTSSFFTHVIRERSWDAGDPHLRRWGGQSTAQNMLLLSLVACRRDFRHAAATSVRG